MLTDDKDAPTLEEDVTFKKRYGGWWNFGVNQDEFESIDQRLRSKGAELFLHVALWKDEECQENEVFFCW